LDELSKVRDAGAAAAGGGLGQPAPDKGTITFDGGLTEPFVVQVSGFE